MRCAWRNRVVSDSGRATGATSNDSTGRHSIESASQHRRAMPSRTHRRHGRSASHRTLLAAQGVHARSSRGRCPRPSCGAGSRSLQSRMSRRSQRPQGRRPSHFVRRSQHVEQALDRPGGIVRPPGSGDHATRTQPAHCRVVGRRPIFSRTRGHVLGPARLTERIGPGTRRRIEIETPGLTFFA